MAKRAQEHELDDDGEGGAPQSHTRKREVDDELQLMMADLRGRARGLSGEALEEEIRAFVDRIIERNARMAPEAMRPEIRRVLRDKLDDDPTLAAVLASLRRAAVRG